MIEALRAPGRLTTWRQMIWAVASDRGPAPGDASSVVGDQGPLLSVAGSHHCEGTFQR